MSRAYPPSGCNLKDPMTTDQEYLRPVAVVSGFCWLEANFDSSFREAVSLHIPLSLERAIIFSVDEHPKEFVSASIW